MSSSFDLDPVVRMTTGAVGTPGKRTFFLQARGGAQLVTLLCEKQQLEALSSTLAQLLDALPDVEDEGPEVADEDLELEEPLLAEWRVGPMSLEVDAQRDLIVIVVRETVEEESEREPASARFVLTRAQGRALAAHAAAVCAAGRPTCRVCGLPLDPEGHTCPALNGHRKFGS